MKFLRKISGYLSRRKKRLIALLGVPLALLLFAAYANSRIESCSSKVYYTAESAPEFGVALLLGTSKYIGGSYDNPY